MLGGRDVGRARPLPNDPFHSFPSHLHGLLLLGCWRGVVPVSVIQGEDGARWDEAIRFLHRMPELGVQPDARHYSAVMGACGRANYLDKVLELLSETRAKGVTMDYRCLITVNGAYRRLGS